MPRYIKFHGLELADNSVIENLRIERLASDPTPSQPGRLWYNTTDKVFKFSSLDTNGAVIVHQAVSLDELTDEINNVNAAIAAETSARSTADSNLQTQIDGLEVDLSQAEAGINFSVTNNGSTEYLIDGSANLTLKLQPGITYRFSLNVSGHPFHIVEDPANHTTTEYNDGLSHDDGAGTVVTGAAAQGQESGTLLFKVPMDAPDYLYYVCDNHPSAMQGILKTTSFPAEVQTEIDDIETGAGLEADGSYLADQTTNYLTAATSLKNADFILDSTIQGVQNELDSTQNGAGLGSSGTYTANAGSNYLTTATSLKDADDKLDTQVKTNADAIAAETTARQNADVTINTSITNLQSEVDAVETGAGLNTDGTYTANGSANYISAATSLKDADNKLDTQVKTNADAIANLGTVTVAGIQTEVDAIETGAGLNTDGTYTADSNSNYITAATSLKDADTKLDTQIKTVQDELDNTQSGAGLAANGSYTTNGSANYISTATSLKDADDLLDAQVKTNADAIGTKVSKSGDTMTGNLDLGNNRIINLPSPVDPSDAATKEYVDSVATGLDVKESVRVATTGNITLTSVTSIDGITLADGDRVLVKNQTTGSENGIYTYTLSTTTLARSSDADTGTELNAGVFVFVEEGTVNADNGFVLVTDNPVTIGTTSLSFEQFSGAGQIIAGAGIQKNGNELYLNFGAGISELPSDEIGIDLRADSGLWLTADGTTDSTATGAELAIKLDGSTLSMSSAGIRVASSVITDISTNTTNITNLQSEVDAIETGAGLGTNGAYTADAGSNYITGATSLANADSLLDAQIKQNSDDIASLSTSVNTAVQGAIDAIEVGAGLASDGSYVTPSGTNYIDTATSLANADSLLDTAIKDNYDTLESLILDLESDIQTETSQRISGDSSVRTDVNNLRFTYQSTATATTHTVSHNLNSNFLLIQVMVLDDDGLYVNDVVPVEETDANTLTLYLTESRHVRCSVMAMTDI